MGRYLANALLERNEKVVVCDLHPTLDERVTKGCEYRQTDIRDKQQLSTIPISADDIIINLFFLNQRPDQFTVIDQPVIQFFPCT